MIPVLEYDSSLGVRGMWSILSLPLLLGPLWLEVVVPVRVSSMGQKELFDIWLRIIKIK